MRMSKFWQLMTDEFGAGYAKSLAEDLVLSPLEGMTAQQALASGVSPRHVWLVICEVKEVPEERRFGKDPQLK